MTILSDRSMLDFLTEENIHYLEIILGEIKCHVLTDLLLQFFNISSVLLREDQFSDSFTFCSHCFLLYTSNRANFSWQIYLSCHSDLINHRLI